MAGTSNFTTLFNRHASKRCAGHRKHHSRCSHGGSAGIEQLEPRFAMTSAGPVAATSAAGVLSIAYAAQADQNVVIEIDEVFPAIGAALTRVNVYTSSNPQALVFTGITSIQVVVPTYDTPGVNNNALTIKGITGLPDRIIVSGSGRTSAGRWSDQSAPELQVLFDIEGIDDLTLTSGGVINVSGAFTNDTSDASIHVIGSIPEFSNSQAVATIVVGETSSFPSTLPQPRLFSNFIEIIGAELDINSDIEATNQVILRLHETTPDTARTNLVLPYDITVSDVALGVLELYSTKNIVQLQGSTLIANTLVAVSNYSNPSSIALIDGPWMIDLGSENNDFNTVSLGMISAPGDKAESYTEGRISVRDTNALTVAGFGILAAAAQVRIDVAGALTFASPIQATGLIGESDDSIVSLAGAVMRLGDLGIALYANDTFSLGSTGDVTLNGPISIDDTDATALVSNKIQATGTTTLAGGIYAPLAGQTTITSSQGIVVGGPIQVGSTRFTSSGTTATVLDHDLALVSDAGSITVGSVVGNSSIPKTIQATNIISLSAFESIDIDGSIFAGTLYGNPLALIASTALPSITIRGNADVSITATGSLQTSAYQTNVDKSPNPLAGLVSISGAAQFNQLGALIADGAVSVDIVGDVFFTGPVKARESVTVKTSAGAIDVQGQIVSTGSTYALLPATPINFIRTPDIVLSAPNGAISTSGLGTLRAGTMLLGAGTTYGEVRLDAQSDILIGASIDTDGGMRATSQIGAFELDALLRTGARQLSPNFQTSFAYLEAFRGVSEGEFGRIITASLNATVTDPAVVAQISLQAFGNQISEFNASNVSPLGDIELVNDSLFAVGAVKALGNINILSTAGISRLGSITAGGTIDLKTQAGLDSIGSLTAKDAITLEATLGINIVGQLNSSDGNITIKSDLAVSERGNIVKAGDSITIDAKMGIRISDGEVKSISVQSRGKFYEYASITVAPPPGGGRTAMARAIINPLVVSDNGDVTGGEITSIIVDDPGSGYVYNEPPVVTIIGSPSRIELITNFGAGTEPISVTIPAGTGAVAVAVVQAFACKLVAKNDITLLSDKYIESSANLLTGTGGKIQVQAESLILDGLLDSGTDIDLGATQNIVLGNTILSHGGDISILSTAGDMDLSADGQLVQALAGNVILTAGRGEITIQRIYADDDVTVTGEQGITIQNEIESDTGNVSLTASAGPIAIKDIFAGLDVTAKAAQDLSLTGLIESDTGLVTLESTSGLLNISNSGKVHAIGGGIDLSAKAGTARVQDLVALGTISLFAIGDVSLNNVIETTGVAGNIDITSRGSINNAARVSAGDSITLSAALSVASLGGEILSLAILSAGTDYEYAIVNISSPASGGGRAATGRATITGGQITALTLVDPGYGYASGEVVAVEIIGQPARTEGTQIIRAGVGATAVASAGLTTSSLSAAQDIGITAGSFIDITNAIHATAGGITMTTATGRLDISDVFSGTDVSLTASQSIDLSGLIRSEGGSIVVDSKGGSLTVAGTTLAPGGSVSLTATGQIVQRGGSVSRQGLFLLSGGRDYTYALVVVSPPPGAGQTALARAVITYYDAFDTTLGGYISDIVLLDGGWGYPSDSRVTVSIQGDGEGAVAEFATGVVISSIEAKDNVTLQGGDTITLLNAVRSATGDVSIQTTLGDIGVQSIKAGATIDVESDHGTVTLVSVAAGTGATLTAHQGITVTNSVNSITGDITIQTTNGDLSFVKEVNFENNYLVDNTAIALVPQAVIAARGGAVTMTSLNGSIVTPYVIHAANDVDLTSFTSLILTNEITSTGGDIAATSTSGRISLAANLNAVAGAITLDAHTSLIQEILSGVTKIELLSPGPMVSEPPDVTVTVAPPRQGGDAAVAVAIIERRQLPNNNNDNGNGNDNNVIEYEYFIGSIVILSPGRGYAVGEEPIVTITGPGFFGAVARAFGPTSMQMVTAESDIVLAAGENVELVTKIYSVAGDVSITSKTGDMDLSADTLFVHALAGGITLTAPGGSATVQHLAAEKNVTIKVQQGLLALNSINSVAGNVVMRTVNKNLDFTPADALIGCETGSVILTSTNGAILSPPVLHVGQNVTLRSFAAVNLSNDITADSGTVTVQSTSGGISLGGDIFAPVESIDLKANKNIVQVTRGIGAVAVLLGGSGYKTGRETVTVNGPGNVAAGGVLAAGQVAATARLIIGSVNGNGGAVIGIQILTAGSGYAVGEVVDVVISPPQVIAGVVGVQALATATAGTATQNLVAGQDVTLTAGSKIVLRGDIIAGDTIGDTISLAAKNGIIQEAGSVKAHSLTLSNANNAAVTLANSANNVVQFAGTTLGSLTYVDADDFETGGIVARLGVPGDIKVEVKADALSLSSVGALSTIRVVSGLQYKTLRIAAGTLGGASVGTVEFVTTSSADTSVPSASFQGSLRDMIRYANDNTATYAIDGSLLPQPTKMVFDEGGYLVEEIIVAAALPGFIKPVAFDGSRLEAFATQSRLGIKGKAGIKTGLLFGLGSSGSSITGTAVYGFKDGSAISLASSNNTVTNTYAGLTADGKTASANSVGLDLTGANARSNFIGSTVFDDTTANRFSANTQAGILIRAGASNNRIFGNILGDDTGLAPTFANGDGIRLNAAGGGNQIGTPSEVGPDLVPVMSNRIVGNKLSGIAFVNTIATGSQTNRVRNNEIDSNGTGIKISDSSFAVIGGPAAHAANVITRQTKAGISLTGSKDVEVIANFIGVDAELTTKLIGNKTDGMAIASSQRVNIAGNRISANTGNGISITTGSTAVTIARNTIGGVLEDGSASGNVLDGVAINVSIGNSVGTGNVISHNRNGVSVTDARGTAATGNKIVGSEIASNTQNGVLLVGGSGTTIGGTTDGTQNMIISNTGDGIRLVKSTKTGAPTGHRIQGNFIGTNENRDVDPSLGNGGNGITVLLGTFNTASGNVVMNNAVDGISIEGGNDNTVGGILASVGNVIANNTANGISIKQSGSSASTGHRIYGNTIVENGGNGVEVNGLKTSKIFVGQDTTGKVVAGRGNTITDHIDGAGVKITAAKQVAVQGNTMGNNRSHIELGSNANPLSGTVTLTSAVFRQPAGGGGKQVEIVGTISGSKANQVYSVDFYANDPGDDDGIRRFIGRGTATADSNGNARIRMTISSDVLLESTITATATSIRYDIGQTTGTLLGGVESRPIVRLR